MSEVSALETLKLVDCPRIVEIVDKDLEAELPWYVMPFYDGGAMRRTQENGEPGDFAESFKGNIDRVLAICADLAETVDTMHNISPPIVHRDIHTQNIFF